VGGVSVGYDIAAETLTLASSVEGGRIYTGGRITLTPGVDGGTWDWDADYFSATFNSPATFTALKAGTSTITYTVNGVNTVYKVTIRDNELPGTGQDDTIIYVLIGVAMLALLAAGVVVRRRATCSK
jgi:LPXTG-motif cell wall-anchored protein